MEYDGDDASFGLVTGLETEFGFVSLRELQNVTGPMGLHIERDLWFRPTPVRELPEYKERWGEGGPYPGKPPVPDQPPDSPSLSEPGSAGFPGQLEGGATPGETESAAPIQELPDGWTATDIHFLLERLAEGPILVAENGLGIPTIHDNFGAETRHLGFGLMQVEGDRYTLRFDAGSAMQHSPSGKSWTRLTIEGQYKGYASNAVRQTLLGWLLPESKSEEIQPWQMTRLTYQESRALQVAGGIPVLNGADGEEHARLVRAALARGDAVPTEVLADYPDLLSKERGSLSSPFQLANGENDYGIPVFSKQITGASAGKLLAEAAARVPDISGIGDQGPSSSLEEQTEFERWELALLTGMLNKRDSAFHRSLKAITQPETLQLALDRIPRTDTQRRTLVEQRLEILSG